MAEYAVFLYAPTEDVDEAVLAEQLEAHDRHAEELQASGVMVAAFALEDTSMSTSVRKDVITDGPFLETKEVIAGFYVIDADDLDGALRIAARNPIVHQGGGVEVRPVAASVVRPTR